LAPGEVEWWPKEIHMPDNGEYEPPAAEAAAEVAAAVAEAYDSEARAAGWLGPEVAFGMMFEHLLPGQSILDLGIGTGLSSTLFRRAGLKVYGLDIDEQMLAVCRWKGFDDLVRHDLTERPYPYPSGSVDHAVCVGVLPFVADLSPVFCETARVLRTRGMFVFMTLDRDQREDSEMVLGPKYTKSDASVTMYRHSGRQIGCWTDEAGFALVESLSFSTYRDAARKEGQHAVCYLAKKARC
jgi:predicted TPR repeat methyltransferase